MYFSIGEHKNIVEALRKGKYDFEKLVTHVYPLEQIDEGFHAFFEDNKSMRVLIKP